MNFFHRAIISDLIKTRALHTSLDNLPAISLYVGQQFR
nr:hypothetical protein [Escherichia coli]